MTECDHLKLQKMDALYEAYLKKAKGVFFRLGEWDDNQIRAHLHDAMLYFDKRPEITWKSEAHKINGVVQKARSLFIDEQRKHKTEVEINVTNAEGDEMTQDEAFTHVIASQSAAGTVQSMNPEDECEKNELIAMALASMTERQRLIYQDSFEGYTPQEISERREIPLETVYKEMQRGLQAARKKLNPPPQP